jgi:transcription elongation factor GreA
VTSTKQELLTMTQSTDQGIIWLTPEAHDKLRAELENLKGPVRQEIIARISSARDEGDLKENGGYHAAKDEQGKVEAEIRQLEEILQTAHTELPADDGVVAVGKVVTYKFEGDDDDEAETFLLGSRENEDYVDLAVFSPQAPLGEALVGATAGSVVEFVGPNGRKNKVEVISAVPYAGA